MKSKYVLNSNRVCSALTGLDVNAFKRLLENFTWVYNDFIAKERKAKGVTVKIGRGRTGVFSSIEDKLILVLFFFKVYPTEEVMGAFFDVDPTTCGKQVRKLRKILELTLGREMVLPKRKISNIDELSNEYPELFEVYIDGTERPVQRQGGSKHYNKFYSKKKKRHTVKNVTMSGKGKTLDKREILVLSPTRMGRRHDKKIADKDQLYRYLNKLIQSFEDSGFMGIDKQHSNSNLPKKKSKNNPLSAQDKLINQIKSSIRVIAEHSNWGLKRLNSIAHTFRHKIPRSDDLFMRISAGIWNFHLLHLEKKVG